MQLRDLPRDILFYVSRNPFRELNVKIIAEKVEGAARKILPPPRAHLSDFVEKFASRERIRAN